MIQIFVLFFLLPLKENTREIKFDLVQNVEDDEQYDPDIAKKTENSVGTIDEITNQTRRI